MSMHTILLEYVSKVSVANLETGGGDHGAPLADATHSKRVIEEPKVHKEACPDFACGYLFILS